MNTILTLDWDIPFCRKMSYNIQWRILKEGRTLTINDLKRLDKRLRLINDPLGTGFQVMYKIVLEVAARNDMPAENLLLQYVNWKWKR